MIRVAIILLQGLEMCITGADKKGNSKGEFETDRSKNSGNYI